MNNAGRPLSAIDTANNIHYAEAAAYTAFGAPTAINFGAVAGGIAGYRLNTPLNTFSKRLQPTLAGGPLSGSILGNPIHDGWRVAHLRAIRKSMGAPLSPVFGLSG